MSGREGTRAVSISIEDINADQEGWYRHQATDGRGVVTKDVYVRVVPGDLEN